MLQESTHATQVQPAEYECFDYDGCLLNPKVVDALLDDQISRVTPRSEKEHTAFVSELLVQYNQTIVKKISSSTTTPRYFRPFTSRLNHYLDQSNTYKKTTNPKTGQIIQLHIGSYVEPMNHFFNLLSTQTGKPNAGPYPSLADCYHELYKSADRELPSASCPHDHNKILTTYWAAHSAAIEQMTLARQEERTYQAPVINIYDNDFMIEPNGVRSGILDAIYSYYAKHLALIPRGVRIVLWHYEGDGTLQQSHEPLIGTGDIDPMYARTIRRMAAKAARQKSEQFWWEPSNKRDHKLGPVSQISTKAVLRLRGERPENTDTDTTTDSSTESNEADDLVLSHDADDPTEFGIFSVGSPMTQFSNSQTQSGQNNWPPLSQEGTSPQSITTSPLNPLSPPPAVVHQDSPPEEVPPSAPPQAPVAPLPSPIYSPRESSPSGRVEQPASPNVPTVKLPKRRETVDESGFFCC